MRVRRFKRRFGRFGKRSRRGGRRYSSMRRRRSVGPMRIGYRL